MSRGGVARVLKPVVGLGLLVLLASRVQLGELAALMREGDPATLAASLGCLVLAILFLQAARLHVLVRHFTGRLAMTLRVFFVGALFNYVLPSGVGGDVVRLVYLRRLKPGSWEAPLGLLLMHRVSGLAVLLVAGGLSAALRWDHVRERLATLDTGGGAPTWGLAVGGALALLVLLLLAVPALRDRVASRAATMAANFRSGFAGLGPADLLALLLLTVVFHGLRIAGFYLAVAYLGDTVAVADLFLVLAVAAVAALLPVSIGGLGVLEGSIAITLELFGVGPAAALASALANRVVLLLAAAIGGVLYVVDRDGLPAALRDERGARNRDGPR